MQKFPKTDKVCYEQRFWGWIIMVSQDMKKAVCLHRFSMIVDLCGQQRNPLSIFSRSSLKLLST